MNSISKKKTTAVLCRVDDKPPVLPLTSVIRPDRVNTIREMAKYLDLTNMIHFRNLLTVHLTGGVVNSFRTKPCPTGKPIRKEAREREAAIIKKENEFMRDVIAKVQANVPNNEQLQREWEMNKRRIHYYKRDCSSIDRVAAASLPVGHIQYTSEISSMRHKDKRPRLLIEVSIKDEGVLGYMTVMLYSDYAPILCERFLRRLRNWENNFPDGNLIYRIFPKFYFISGIEGSLTRPAFNHDHYCNILRHAEPGVMSIYNVSPKINGSQVIFTFSEQAALDDRNDYFPIGKIIEGMGTLRNIECEGTELSGMPKMPLFISNVKEI